MSIQIHGPLKRFEHLHLATVLPPPRYATLDPTRMGSGISLSNNDLTVDGLNALNGQNRWRTVLGTKGYSSGSDIKVYVEILVGANTRVGLANSSVNLNDVIETQGFPSFANLGGGLFYQNKRVYVGSAGKPRSDIVMIAWTGTHLYVGRNGVWLNARPGIDPGLDISALSGTIFLAITVLGANDPVTANFGPTFKYAPPTGYGPW